MRKHTHTPKSPIRSNMFTESRQHRGITASCCCGSGTSRVNNIHRILWTVKWIVMKTTTAGDGSRHVLWQRHSHGVIFSPINSNLSGTIEIKFTCSVFSSNYRFNYSSVYFAGFCSYSRICLMDWHKLICSKLNLNDSGYSRITEENWVKYLNSY